MSRFRGEMTPSSGSQAWSHKAQADPEEREDRMVSFDMPTQRTSLRWTMVSRAQWPGTNSRAWRPGSMSSITFPRSLRGGYIDRHIQVPPEVRVLGAPAEPAAMYRHTTIGTRGPPAPVRGQAATGMNSLPGIQGRIPTGPAAWRQTRERDNAAGYRNP